MSILFKKAQSRVIVYDWDIKAPDDDTPESLLAVANRIHLSKHIQTISFSKALSSPSGTFEIMLDNSRDWRRVVRRGTWCTLYYSNKETLPLDAIPEARFVRGLCYIERIAERVIEQEDGSQDVSYVVTGRDYGKIYEDTEIWHNTFKFEGLFNDANNSYIKLKDIETTDKLIELGHKLFFSSKSDITKDKEFTEVAQQWLMPDVLLQDLGLKIRKGTTGPFFGHIEGLFNFAPTKTVNPVNNPLLAIRGKAWSKLKEWSVEPLHELYTELTDAGAPQLIYRPIPWGINPKGYPALEKIIPKYKDLAKKSDITITDAEITSVDVGEDEHNRYNHFYAWSSAVRMKAYDAVSELEKPSALDKKFPYAKKASILRHGFKPMHTELNTLTFSVKKSKNGQSDPTLLAEYNEVLYDYWSPAVYFESGSVTIIGRNDIKLGKAIVFDEGSKGKLGGKVFYVEGYSDELEVDEDGSQTWYQTLQLTRGIKLKKLDENYEDFELEQNDDEEIKGFFVED